MLIKNLQQHLLVNINNNILIEHEKLNLMNIKTFIITTLFISKQQ